MRSENSGLIDLDALMKEASQPELPQSADDSLETLPPVLEPPIPASVEPPASPPHPSSSSAVVVAKPVSVPVPVPVRVSREKREIPSTRSRRPWLAVAAVAGVALVLVIFGRSREPKTSVVSSPAIANATANATAGVAESSPPTPAGVSLGDLPAAAMAATPSPTSAPHVSPRAPSSSSASLVAIGDAPSPTNGDLGGAMREAVGPRSSADLAVTDPTTSGSARQLKPSPGAVVGAINSVLPTARACLGEDDAARGATIVFKSDGTVGKVELAAPAHASDECIRGALSKARTMPFVEDTFAARATVRP